jgi:nitrite reductase/ring-hydroxylating ferredoxin subunit
MSLHTLCPASEIGVGEHKEFQIGRYNFGVFKVGEGYYALNNKCPHQGLNLCDNAGVFDQIEGEVTEDRKLREFVKAEKNLVACPWHGIEFEITTGQCLFRKDWKVKTYEVTVDADNNLQINLPD